MNNQTEENQTPKQPLEKQTVTPAPPTKETVTEQAAKTSPGKPIKKIAKFNLKKAIPIVLIIFIGFGAIILLNRQRANSTASKTTPTPIPTKKVEKEKESPYANDPEVLQIEKNIQEVEEDLKNLKFRELPLLPPKVNMDIDIKE